MRQFHSGDKVVIFWQPKYDYGKLSFPSCDINFYNENSARFEPVYPELNYIPSSWFVSKMPLLKKYFTGIKNTLPPEIIAQKGFREKNENILAIHFPSDAADFERARNELAYEELFLMQYAGILRKQEFEADSEGKSVAIPLNIELIKNIIEKFPFPLTDHQKITTFQILKDMERSFSMNRLLQGDVWTGKTAVALIAAIHAIIEAGIQVAFMVPTEILARQHFSSIQELLSHYNITSDLLVGSLSGAQKKAAQARLKNGETQVVIGTHALIQDDVHFKKLGFVIIDEQHRFGVEQRKALEQYNSFGLMPHILHMTATPIPRTLALTIYGDQDISTISQYPVGRKLIHTKVIKEHERDQVYRFIEEEVRNWRQVYWISPLVEESESLDIANATSMTEHLRDVFPNFTIWLLHGRMKGKEKDEIMTDFLSGKIQILSSTSVVEVWVNNQNASVICMEAAERFWLSQLHQFRGRVGRGQYQSYCYLFTTKAYTGERLKAMEQTNNGFELAEIDLELRGPGEVYGVRQSGIPDFKIANLKDFELISEIREDIEIFLRKEPKK